MTATIEALIAIAIVLLLAVVVMLGVLLRRRPSSFQSPVSPQQKPSTINQEVSSSCLKNEKIHNLPARREFPNNPEHILATKDCLRELSQIGSNLAIWKLYQTIPANYQKLNEYLGQNQNNFSLDFIWNFVSSPKAADIRTGMEQACVESMELILAIYSTEFLPMIFDTVPEAAHLKSKFTLTEAYTAQESLNGQNALRRNLSPIYSELNELTRVQEQLISSFPQLQTTVGNGSTDWGDTALTFGAGALAVVNPLIGVPFLFARYFGSKKKDGLNNAFIKNYGARFDEYCNRWNSLNGNYQTVFENQSRYIEEKMRDVSERAIPNILSELDAQGFNLERVPVIFRKFLQEVKQKHSITASSNDSANQTISQNTPPPKSDVIWCPKCSQKLPILPQLPGIRLKCITCGHEFVYR